MTDVQRVPVGYLELLGIKAAGKTVPQAAEFLQPSMEMADFYGSILYGSALASVASAAFPNPVTITVPAGEIWFLLGATLTSNIQNAATQFANRILVSPIGASAQGVVVAADKQAGGIAIGTLPFTWELAWQPPRPWILRPGSIIIGNVSELDGVGNVENILQALFYRIPF